MRLYFVTDRRLLCGRDLFWVVERAVMGGVDMVQIREKDCSTREFVELAASLKKILSGYGVPLIINDRVDVALAVDADGVHVGQSDMEPEVVRLMLGRDKIVGLSVESREQLLAANNMDVNYVALSPIFDTATKTDTVTQWGLDGVRWARSVSTHPIVAIGGINLSNAYDIVHAGADSLALVSGLCSADDPAQAAENFKRILEI